MPRDHWLNEQRKEIAKAAGRKKERPVRKSRESWLSAIRKARTNEELTMVARSLAVMYAAKRLTKEQYSKLVAAGKAKRRMLMQLLD